MLNRRLIYRRFCAAILIIFLAGLTGCTSTHIASGRINAKILEQGNVGVPSGAVERSTAAIDTFGKNDLSGPVIKELIDYWAQKELPSWDIEGAKVNAPRIILAKLITGLDIRLVNDYLLNTATEPWSGSGSTWLLRRGGDYDFTEAALTAVLYKFGDQPERLYPETRDHLLHTLLTEEGSQIRPYVPGSLRIVPDTENHILMTEGSRYLKNQWLRDVEGLTDPEYDNRRNGVETFLSEFLDELIGAGLFEFNSMPYSGYTITALLNLEAYAEDPVAAKARELLDTIAFKFALGSLDMRRCVPFRRQTGKAGTTSLQADDTSMISRVWVSLQDPDYEPLPITGRLHNSFYAAVMPYRVPVKTFSLIKEKEFPYFLQLGRGPEASPEIFSGGQGYLLSAGGVSRGRNSMIVTRPITLILSDERIDYTDCFYIPGRGNYREWNNTGVFRNFACSNNTVVIPAWAAPAAASGRWRIYNFKDSLMIAVFNDEPDGQYGIMVLFPDYPYTPDALADALRSANPDHSRLQSTFIWPTGETLTYDINAPQDKWVMTSYNGEALDRAFDSWPRINSLFRTFQE